LQRALEGDLYYLYHWAKSNGCPGDDDDDE
jgi:hypothetical protein